MKLLVRLALLSCCAAIGLIVAVRLAATESRESPPQASAAPPASPSREASASDPTPSPHREVAQPRFEPLRPRVTAEVSRDDEQFQRRSEMATAAMEQNPPVAAPPQYVAQAPVSPQINLDANTINALMPLIQGQLQHGTTPAAIAPQQLQQMAQFLLQNQQQLPAMQGLQSPVPGAIVAQGPGLTAPQNTAASPALEQLDPLTAAARAQAARQSTTETIATPSTSTPAEVAAEGDGLLTIHAHNSEIREVLDQLAQQAGLNLLAAASVDGTINLNLDKVGVDEALDAILKAKGLSSRRDGNFVYIGVAEDFAAMERAQDRISTRVYRPNYISARDLQVVVAPLLTPTTGKISVTTPPSVGIAVDNTAAGGDAMSQQDALVIQDYETVLAQVDQLVKDLDRRPAQVSIEAMIISVTLNDENRYGVDFQLLRDKSNIRLGWGTPLASAANTVFDGGLKFAFLDSSMAVFISALETVGDANVVASPKLLCLNKQKAEVLIGQKLGYISTTVADNFSTQNVEFLDVGAQLRLRPFISSDGLIRLEVHPELSEGEVVVNGGFTLPRKTLTEVTTNVMCPDGCTVIIGGLMRQNLRSNTSQVPLMGSLPAVGPLFRRKTENIERTEIIVLLTPKIVYDGDVDAEGRLYESDMRNMESAKFHRMSPISKAHLSRDYVDRARSAMQNGNRLLAERYGRLAVHYDPLNRDAVRLLAEMGGGAAMVVPQGLGVETIVGDEGLALPDGELTPWMLEELGRGDSPPQPMHPRDPGLPGPSFDLVRPEVFRGEVKK